MRNYDNRPTAREAELDQIRKEQAQTGRRMTLGIKDENRRFDTSRPKSAPPRKDFVSKGHDVTLKEIQDRRGLIKLYMTSGRVYKGTLIARDKYTVTLSIREDDNPAQDYTLYKSAIEGFKAEA